MKISASCGGGFAGIVQRYEIDTAASPSGPALEAAVHVALAGPGAAAEPEPVGADLLHWTVTADDGRQRHTLTFTENGAPPWQDLLDLIRSAA